MTNARASAAAGQCMTSCHPSETFIARRPAADRRSQTSRISNANPKSVSSQVSRRTEGVSLLEHHATSARHREQIAVPGRLRGVASQGAMRAVVVDEVFQVGEEIPGVTTRVRPYRPRTNRPYAMRPPASANQLRQKIVGNRCRSESSAIHRSLAARRRVGSITKPSARALPAISNAASMFSERVISMN